jgi:putative restriction endonuclease
LRQAIHYVYLDDELFELLQEPRSRHSLVSALIATWFSGRQGQIEHLLNIDALQTEVEDLRQRGGVVYQPEDLKDEDRTVVRDAAFRRVIVSIYEYRCAFCRLQVIDALGQNIVDGSHIKPFSQFYDDRIDNGISLCKNHHWGFDRGWFAIQDDYTLLVSEDLREESPHATPMREFSGRSIRLPAYQQYYPRTEALRWHRENVFGSFSNRA